ncbi:MAG TPA: hypothetical protein VF195_12870 [Actinomycetota bacterium]
MTKRADVQEVGLMKRRSWIVAGSLTGLVACSALVALAPVLVRDLRGPVYGDLALPALLVSGAAGIFFGGIVASRTVGTTPRRIALLGAACGAILGAVATGSVFLAVEVAGDDWPHGLAAFVTGGIIGAVVGGFLGGAIGIVQVDSPAVDEGHAPRGG